MLADKIIVNDVQKSKNKVLVLVRVDNYKNMLKRVSVGESIKTEPIQMNFHDSIGKSSWILIYYPKGQYIGTSDANVKESGRASIYLKMVYCENENETLSTIIKVLIKSPNNDFNYEFGTTKFATLSFRDPKQRWIGPLNLADTDELYSKRCKNFFLNDSLTIGCELIDTTLRSNVPRSIENRPSSDAGFNIVKERKSSIVGSELTNAAQIVPRLQSKGIRRSEGSYNSNAKVDGTNEGSEKKIPDRRFSSAFRNDVMKENEHKNVCLCGQPNRKISRETQTWDERLLRVSNKNLSSNEADALAHRNHGCEIFSSKFLNEIELNNFL